MFWVVQKVLDKKLITYFLLGLIFALAVFLRFYNLSSYPVGFHQDEASLGYNGYSLLLTGKDDNNKPLPLYIDMFGDNRPSGYHYLTILPIKFLGLTEFATRFPSALFGVLAVLLTFFLVKRIFWNKEIQNTKYKIQNLPRSTSIHGHHTILSFLRKMN